MSTFSAIKTSSSSIIKSIEKQLVAQLGEISGTDSDDFEYTSINQLWKNELAPVQSTIDGQSKWYSTAYDYWENEANCPLSDDGVLGGYGKVTPMDVRDSNLFLDLLAQIRPQLKFDIAAGNFFYHLSN